MKKINFLIITFLALSSLNILGQESYISNTERTGYFPLSSAEGTADIYVDENDHKGVLRVAEDFQKDIQKVTGKLPQLHQSAEVNGNLPVIIGTMGKSRLIDGLAEDGKIDISEIDGKWETFSIQVVENPYPDVDMALVIAGSDKRGTIFGIYDVSEEIGVSPWHWWADVPVEISEELYVKTGSHSDGPPKVKYRGIFINDEEPALGNWAREKFGGINSKMYTHVFKLILRLKGNYLWPAMWGKAFNEDDPLNPELADEYGIVMGTSHHEPMMRAQKEWATHKDEYGNGEWDYQTNAEGLSEFWRDGFERNQHYENLVTIGMRGDGDEPMTEGTAIELLETIVEDQREIIADVTGKPAEATPQVWALYKEVQDYYDQGMRVPDDVTLLLADDNWGNIRKLPDPEEEPREGGYGVYYHFDYVGGPRNHKWINTTQSERVWEQMNLAYEYDATEIWVVNVGDLKPMEFPISFFLDYAWNPEKIDASDLESYTENWAEQQFGKEHAEEIAEILEKYTKYNSRRKPELLSPETYTLTNYKEAQRVLKDYKELSEKAEEINNKLPKKYQDAYFQLVLFPVKASANLNELYVATAKNRLYARQGRASANKYAEKVEELYEKDAELTEKYHNIADGKWNHMMSQVHIGYTYWQQPEEQSMPEVEEIEVPEKAEMGVAVEGSENNWPNADSTAALPTFDRWNDQEYYVAVFNKGQKDFKFRIRNKNSWINFSEEKGTVEDQKRIWVSIDWAKAPKGEQKATIEIRGPKRSSVEVEIPINNPESRNMRGFIESNGYISIEATNFSEKRGEESGWKLIPNLGKTGSAMATYPENPTHGEFAEDNPYLAYDFHTFSGGEAEVEFFLSPTLDFRNQGGLKFAVSIDGEEPQIINMHEDTEDNWDTSVANNVTRVNTKVDLGEPGNHILKVWAIETGIVLQKIIIKTGDLQPSYLGPPESANINN